MADDSIFEPDDSADGADANVQPEPERQEQTVPLAALNEARAEQRQLQSELNQLRGQVSEFEGLREQLDEYRKAQQSTQQEDEFNSDPLGTMRRELSELRNMISGRQNEELTEKQREQQEQQMTNMVASQVAEFKRDHEDYELALRHVMDTRKQELTAMGYPEGQVQQALAQEAQALAMSAIQSGQNPGQLVYDLAKMRGYAPPEPQERKKEASNIERLERGQKAAGSLSGSGAEEGGLSLTEIENMSDEQFDAFWQKFSAENQSR